MKFFSTGVPHQKMSEMVSHITLLLHLIADQRWFIFVAGIIRHYRLRVRPVGGGLSGGTFIIDASTTSIVLTSLDCCTSYTYFLSAYTIAYGASSPREHLQTYPDLSSEFTNYC